MGERETRARGMDGAGWVHHTTKSMETLERMLVARDESIVDDVLPHLIQLLLQERDERRLFHFLTAASRLNEVRDKERRVSLKLLTFLLMLAAPTPFDVMRSRLLRVLSPRSSADDLAVTAFLRSVVDHFSKIKSGYEPDPDVDVPACARLLRLA